MAQYLTIRTVKLPDGIICKETAEEIRGGSETQLVYTYETLDGKPLKGNYKRDYWGDIKGAKEVDE